MSIPESALNYGSILTLLGENAEVNGKLNNKSITFTHIAIGDGNDQYVQPSRTQTTLVNEITRIPVTGMEKIEPSEEGGIPQLKVWAKIPDNIVDVAVREFAAIAVYDGNSYLHAVGNSVRIPILSGINNGGEVNDIYIEMTFAITSLDPIVMIDPTVVTATRQYVNERNDEHLNSSNPHPQYAVQKDVDGIKMVLIEGGVNQSVRFEIAESGQLGFSLFYNGADDNATYLQSNIFGTYRNLVKIPREVARWDFLAPAYYSGYQLLDKSFVASPAEVIAGNTTKVATGEGVLAALAKAHSNGMLSPTGSYVFPKDENGLSLIIQWGIDAQITGQGSGDKTVVLPIAFPNGIFLALTTPGMIGGTTGDCVGYVAGSQTNFTYNWNSNNATGFEVSWFALGY